MTKFQKAIQDIPDKALAETFGISRPSVRRWKSGQNAPHLIMQKVVFEKLETFHKVFYGCGKFGI